jgi:hypothetical protein
MGFRFRRSVSFGPLRLNFSKRGVGMLAGVRGARVTLGADGKVRETLSLPGTGLSYQHTETAHHGAREPAEDMPRRWPSRWVVGAVVLAFVVAAVVWGRS